MTEARDQILRAVRAATPPPERSRFASGRQALLPPRFVREARDLETLFLAKLATASATHSIVPAPSDVPMHLASFFAAQDMPVDFLLAREPALAQLDWTGAGLHPRQDEPQILQPGTIVGGAFAGVAETGSLVLTTSGPSRPIHNLMARHHIVILDRSCVLPAIEDVWRAVARERLPRSLAFVTGPSRTADIEMSLELGVHGAVALHVVLTGPATTAG